MNFSIIIPVAPFDNAWKALINDLSFLDENDECIFVSPVELSNEIKISLPCSVKWLCSPIGRAKQQNLAAQNARNDFLWFIHCDSRLSLDLFIELRKYIAKNKNAIHYFNLKFADDSSFLMKINEAGVLLRSRIFKMPFGDQAFCMHKDIFFKLGQFDESVSYGEDHLFIWKAHQENVKIKCINKSIITSSRKYQKYGWGKTTLKHVTMTYKQAIPQFIKLLKRVK